MKGIYRWVLLVALVILVVDIELFTMATRVRLEAVEQARTNLRVAADVVLGRVEQKLDTYDRTLSGIGEVASVKGALPVEPDLALHRLLVRRHAITPGLRWLLLVREDGRLAEISSVFPAPGVDLSDREYFEVQAKEWDHGLFIGAPLESRIDQEIFIPLSRRLVNEGNRFQGAIAAGLDPLSLEHLLTDQALPTGYTLRLMLNNGQALICVPANALCRDQDWAKSPVFDSLLSNREHRGHFDSRELLEQEYGFGAYAKSERYPVLVTTTVAEEQVLSAWRDSLYGYLALILVSNAALIGIALFAFRQFQKRQLAMAQLAEANLHLEERVASRTEELRQSEIRARTFMNTAMDAVVVIDSDDHIIELNQAAERMFGYKVAEALGSSLGLLMPPDEAQRHPDRVRTASRSGAVRGMGPGREVMGRRRDGSLFPIEVTVGGTGDEGLPLYVGVIRDITERKIHEQELKRLATVDGLTGILNRRAFTDQTEKLASLARRHRRPLALMILDADRFKHINDTYGHPAGDQVLKALAQTLGEQVRSTDLLGRLGGEEFGIALPETDFSGAWELGNRILAAIRACKVSTGGHELIFTVSIGLALLDSDGTDDLESVVKRADEALYRAKNEGRDRLLASFPMQPAES